MVGDVIVLRGGDGGPVRVQEGIPGSGKAHLPLRKGRAGCVVRTMCSRPWMGIVIVSVEDAVWMGELLLFLADPKYCGPLVCLNFCIGC